MADDKYKSAGNIRSKITRFDFKGTASANIALSKKVGDVASVIEKKTDEQNRRFDKLLKVLEFLPKDALEKRKQDKIVFTELARTVAMLEKEAKASIKNRPKYFELRKQADDLREQGRKLAPDFDKSKPQGIKEWGYKILGFNPQRARENGLGGEIAQTLFPTFTGIAKKFSNKNSFDRQVEQEKLYPETASKTEEAMIEARKKGGIEYTDEKGITSGKGRGEGGGEGSSSAILRTISHAVLDIRDHIVGKGDRSTAHDDTVGEPPKGLFTPEQLAKRDPKNWKTFKIRKKGKFTGKTGKIWNRKSQWTGRGISWDDPDLPPPEPETPGLTNEQELTPEQKARAGASFDDEKRHNEGQDQPQPKYAESGTEKEEPTKVEGGMTGDSSGIAIVAILGAIVEAVTAGLAVAGPIAVGIAGAGLILKDIFEYMKIKWVGDEARGDIADTTQHTNAYLASVAKKHGMTVHEMMTYNRKQGSAGAQQVDDLDSGKLKTDKWNNPYEVESEISPFEDLARYVDPDAAEDSKKLAFGPFFKNGMIEQNKFNKSKKGAWLDFGANGKEVVPTGDALANAPSRTTPTIISAPVTNNTVNNNGGGGGSSKSSDLGMPSARTPNPTFRDTEAKRQTRQF